jgi:hypothetical protein
LAGGKGIQYVIPAEAGIQIPFLDPVFVGIQEIPKSLGMRDWIPASAGMTAVAGGRADAKLPEDLSSQGEKLWVPTASERGSRLFIKVLH